MWGNREGVEKRLDNVKKTYFHDIAVEKSNSVISHTIDHTNNCRDYTYRTLSSNNGAYGGVL